MGVSVVALFGRPGGTYIIVQLRIGFVSGDECVES